MSPHDRILSYRTTYEQLKQPLILVVGREPSFNATEITSTMGPYDFRKVSSSSFWNVIYRYLAQAAGIDDEQLKRLCESADASPIVMGDALPIGVCNGDPKVSEQRANVCETSIMAHVQNTLELANAKESVKLVILAGHLSGARGNKRATENLSFANEQYKTQMESLNDSVPVIDTAFMSNLNSKALCTTLSSSEISIRISDIFNQFFDYDVRQAA